MDFIFGSACAYFENCQIHSLSRDESVNGYVTASSTPKGESYGYVFFKCSFTSNCRKHTVYLGRPWREYAKTVLVCCNIENHIIPAGWDDWNRPNDHGTVFFAECACNGPGAVTSGRADWIHILSQEQAAYYTKELVLGYKPV